MRDELGNLSAQFDAMVEFATELGAFLNGVKQQVKSEMIGLGWPEEQAEQAGYLAAFKALQAANFDPNQHKPE